MAKFIIVYGIRIASDFTPETFGRLTTIGPRFSIAVSPGGRRKTFQVCQCSCGAVKVCALIDLVAGDSMSCGCLKREVISAIRTKHGESTKTAEYRSWKLMKCRCKQDDRQLKRKAHYANRGITVCERWLDPENGYLNFLADMGRKPGPKYSLEREDVNGNYCTENCIWATTDTQARNKRNNINITAFGKTQCITDWANETGIERGTIRYRLKVGWPVEKALTKLPRQNNK